MAITQKYNLNLIPNKMPLSVHVSQYDKSSRIIEFDLYNGATPFTIPSGSTITVRGGKPDGTGYEYACSYAAGTHGGSTVSATIEEQMTVLPGHQPAEIRIAQGAQVLGTANFEFFVEASPMEEGAISETELPFLEEVAQTATQAAARAETAAEQVEQTVEAVESIVPQSTGSAGQVLTNTGSGADWQEPIMNAADKAKLDAIDIEKLDAIGYTYSKGFNSKTLTNATYENMATLTGLPKGTYLVITLFNFSSNQTGARRTITYPNLDTIPDYSRYNGAAAAPATGGVTLLQYTRVLSLNEETNTIGLAGYQSSGSDMTGCAGMIYATRIA